MTKFDDLVARLVPPAGGGESLPWRMIEEEWGIMFPDDYKKFIEIFGPGTIGESLAISAPLYHGHAQYNSSHRLTALRAEALEMLGSPFPAHPALGGLLVLGAAPSGDTLFYRTAALPEDWHVVTWLRAGRGIEEQWVEYEMGFVDFLLALLRAELPSHPFDDAKLWRTEQLAYHSWRNGS